MAFSLAGFMESPSSLFSAEGLQATMDEYGRATAKMPEAKPQAPQTLQQQKYEQVQQRSGSTGQALPFDTKYLIFGGVGLVALIVILKA